MAVFTTIGTLMGATATAAFGTGLAATALAGSAIGAGMNIMAGQSQAAEAKRQGEYNAKVYEQQAGMIGEQKRLEGLQYDRARARLKSTGIARTAGSGFEMSGSPLALMLDTETQMNMDKEIGQYNWEVQKRYTQSGATAYRDIGANQSRLAKWTGYSNAYSTLLNGVGTYARSI